MPRSLLQWSWTAVLLFLCIGLPKQFANGYSSFRQQARIGPTVIIPERTIVIGGQSIRSLSLCNRLSVSRRYSTRTRLYYETGAPANTGASARPQDVTPSKQLIETVDIKNELWLSDQVDKQQDSPVTPHQSSVTTSHAIRSPSADIPSYRAILTFVFTTVLIWLSEPLLSLVDTTVIGRPPKHARGIAPLAISPVPMQTIQLASLGPATLLCDTLVYLTYFLAIATTNSVSFFLCMN